MLSHFLESVGLMRAGKVSRCTKREGKKVLIAIYQI